MFLSKKDTPPQFLGMWYAGVLNILACYTNSAIYFANATTMNLILCCASLIVAVIVYTLIKHQTQAMLWGKLTTVEHTYPNEYEM